MELRNLDEKFEKGFKVNYGDVRRAVMKCELESKERQISQDCKRIFKELNIDVIDNGD